MSWPKFWTKQHAWQSYALKPLSMLVCFIANKRLNSFKITPPPQTEAKVIVVGNIVVGGAGKTPFIFWLGKQLEKEGISYGIVTRGYGGQSNQYPILVDKSSEARQVGDEPVLFAKNLSCPVAVSPKRVEAIELLNKNYQLEVIISDDGLQHYAMARDIEVIVFDGQRCIGNGLCMPAGPLRESANRIKEATYIVSNGRCKDGKINGLAKVKIQTMVLKPAVFRRVNNPNKTLALDSFTSQNVQAIAGIGNPQRFYETLNELNIKAETKDFPDHKNYQLKDFNWKINTKPLLMTEKDAVKCYSFAADDWWYLEVQPSCPNQLFEQIREQLNGH